MRKRESEIPHESFFVVSANLMSGSLALMLIGLAVPMCCDANLTRLLDLVFALGDFSLCSPIFNDGNNMKVDCWFDLLPTMSPRVNFENPVDGW